MSGRGALCSLFVLLATISLTSADFSFPNFSNASLAAMQADLLGVAPLQYLMFNKSSSEAEFVNNFVITPDNSIIITSNASQTSFAMWYSNPQYVVDGFVANFSWTVTDKHGLGGDGVAFVLEADGLGGPANVKPLGAAGKGMGYSGIKKSIAVEFDMYLDPDQADPNDNHVSAHSRGEAPNNSDERGQNIDGSLLDSDPRIATDPLGNNQQMDTGTHYAVITYTPNYNQPSQTNIQVYMDGRASPTLTVYVDIGNMLKLIDGYAYVGLTSATGDSYQYHVIHDFSFVGEPAVKQLIPSCGPIYGGTYVQVIGVNYKNASAVLCVFGGNAPELPGTYVTDSRVDCIAPPQATGYVNVTLSFMNTQPLHTFVPYFYYPPPNITTSIPLGGPITGATNVTVTGQGFQPMLISSSSCRFGPQTTAVLNMTETVIVCAPTPPSLNGSVGMNKLDISLNSQQYTNESRDFYYYYPFIINRFVPQGGFVAGGDIVLLTGNYTMTPELTCRFNDTTVPAIINQEMYYKFGVPHMLCLSPPHSSGYFTLEVSGNNQQFTDFGYMWIYDANYWIWLIAGAVGFVSILAVCLCANCWATLWKFKDYRLMATKEYRDMTGKTGLQSLRDLVAAADAEERRKMIQVLNMLKMKRKANQPKFSQKSRWGVAAARALSQKRAEQMTGWDALLLGDHTKKGGAAAAAAAGGGAGSNEGGAASSASAGDAGKSAEKKPAPGAAWGAIMNMSKDATASKGGAKTSGWAKLSQNTKSADKKGENQPLL